MIIYTYCLNFNSEKIANLIFKIMQLIEINSNLFVISLYFTVNI